MVGHHDGYTQYPPEMKSKVVRWIKDGLSCDEILARSPFRSRRSLLDYCRNNKLGRPHDVNFRWAQPEDIEAVRHLLNNQEMNYTQIAAKLGWTRGRVAGIAWRFGLNRMLVRPERFEIVYGDQPSHRHRQDDARHNASLRRGAIRRARLRNACPSAAP